MKQFSAFICLLLVVAMCFVACGEVPTPDDDIVADGGTTPDGGEGTTPDGGEGTTPDGGEGTTPDGGEGTTPDGSEGTTPDGGEGTTPNAGVYVRDGDYIYFGEFPQTLKAANVTITTTTDERGYYLGSDGAYYAEVSTVGWEAIKGNLYTFSDGTQVKSNRLYYFKVEPIRWRILSEDGETAFLFCDSIIANTIFGNSSATTYANSIIREWLNGWFYNNYFGEAERDIILTTLVDNSIESTSSPVLNPYVCEDTEDKVFLLSFAEATNAEYGFMGRFDLDEAKELITSDYARATAGAYMDVSEQYYGNGWWWLRSCLNTDSVECVSVGGACSNVGGKYYTTFGVAPALRITL